MSDRAPGIIGAGLVAIIGLGFGSVYVASSYQLAERARSEET
jgi:hypothetical protein